MMQNGKETRVKALSTSELWARLFKSATLDRYLSDAEDIPELPPFAEYISGLAVQKGERAETILKRGAIESSFGHRLFSGARKPSRDTVIQLAFGFMLDADETQTLLKVARMTALHPRVKRDAVIAFCLQHHKSFMDAQELLYENKMPLIGGKRSGA